MKDFENIMAEEFEQLEFRQTFLLMLLDEEDFSVTEALCECIRIIGVKSFAKLTRVSSSKIDSFLKSGETSTSIVEKILSAFDLRLYVRRKVSYHD